MCDGLPQGGMDRLAQKLRSQLQEMTAVVHVLASAWEEDERTQKYLAVLNQNICIQLRLVRQLELEGRLHSGELEPSLMDLVELGRSVMQKVDALTRPMLDIKAEFSTPLTALPTWADRGALEDMLLAFIANSVRAIGRSGAIRLELEQQDGRAVFTVTDTGGGIEPDILAGLFSPLDDPETPTRGLLQARRIAELHGGTVIGINAEPAGARIAVSIPVADQSDGMLHSPSAADSGGGWDPALVALSNLLPLQAFLPGRRKNET